MVASKIKMSKRGGGTKADITLVQYFGGEKTQEPMLI